ncbi:MAG: chemotaxis response regulator protein-glutamate methylesterase [Deltaproteobacteria bacterium]|nr:chemotaxis response regulator protein-glutamate methylesterase [Deltaproteobacteria bacterium]
MAGAIRVLVVDDSAFARQLLSRLLSTDPAIAVVGVAADVSNAWRKIAALQPDVITLDVSMPDVDGLTFLAELMRRHPLPVVMVSALTEHGCATTLRALELGAIDFVTKPRLDSDGRLEAIAAELVQKVKVAAQARMVPPGGGRAPAAPWRRLGQIAPKAVVAIGASTGGPAAVAAVLAALPADAPGIVIVQHMPERFTGPFAERLDQCCALAVKQANDGDLVHAGRVLLAPGDAQVELVRDGPQYHVRVFHGPRVSGHRPSVDVLFHSVARCAGPNALGVLMTGMGADGAVGLLAMHRAGARTLAQDQATAAIYGMPREAVALGAADASVALDRIAPEIIAWAVRVAGRSPGVAMAAPVAARR